MSTVPPPQQPPIDPKSQWRAYRDQQRAAWRAQKYAWKAQRQTYRGVYAPRVPSIVGPLILVAIGVIALLIMWGKLSAGSFWDWYGKWWPILLIGAGLALLAEWIIDQRREVPVRRGGSFVGVLVLLAFVGIIAAIARDSRWNGLRNNWGNNSDDFFNVFGRPQHDQDQQVLNTAVPANAVIEIQNPRGDVSITAGDTPTVQVQAHQVAFANSDDEARKIFDAEKADVAVSGGTVVVKTASHDQGRVNLTVTVPKGASVNVEASRGDITAAGLGNGATISASHGDIHLSTIKGSVQVHFASDKGDFSAHDVTGDITADGKCNDLTLSEVHGKIAVNGDIFGDAHLENLSGGVHIHTSRTDLQFGDLPGDMTLNDDELNVTDVKGGVRVTTRSKNITLTQVAGDTFVDDRRGDISIEPTGSYNVEAHNNDGHGDVVLTLPENASVSVDGRTKNGEILSDFPLAISGDESKTVSGKIGSGQAKVTLSTDVGDLRIKRGQAANAFTPPAPAKPAKPAPPNAPHLKPSKTPAAPVTQ